MIRIKLNTEDTPNLWVVTEDESNAMVIVNADLYDPEFAIEKFRDYSARKKLKELFQFRTDTLTKEQLDKLGVSGEVDKGYNYHLVNNGTIVGKCNHEIIGVVVVMGTK